MGNFWHESDGLSLKVPLTTLTLPAPMTMPPTGPTHVQSVN